MKKMSVLGASCIIAGYGIGSGVLAIPYMANKCGLTSTIIILFLAFIFSYLLHLMIADLSIKSGTKGEIIEAVLKYLPSNKWRQLIKTLLFSMFAIIIYINLTVYISASSEILYDVLNMPIWICKLIFYIIASIVSAFSIRILSICEKYAMSAIMLVILILVIGSFFNITNVLPMKNTGIINDIILFGITMLAYLSFFSVPQVVIGLEKNVKKIKKAIMIGMLINFLIIFLIIVFAQLSSTEITQVAITGWCNGIGIWSKTIGTIFTILAMLTTYWAMVVALRDEIHNITKLNKKLCIIIASVPAIIIAEVIPINFLGFLELLTGAMAILIIFFLIPVFHISCKDGKSILGKWACLPIEILVCISYIIMAISSII